MAEIAAARLQRILELTNRRGIVSVRELCDELGVSDMTIRRDFRVLARQGALHRTRGGALSITRPTFDYSYDERQRLQTLAKDAIGRAAAELVEAGESLFLSGGTTSLALGRHLRGRTRLTIITNSAPVVCELMGEPDLAVISTGGLVRQGTGTLTGPITENSIAQFQVRKAFLGATGLSPNGVSIGSLEEAAVYRKMRAGAAETYLLVDHTKFGRQSLALVAGLAEVTGVVTDAATSPKHRQWLREAGVRVVVAEL